MTCIDICRSVDLMVAVGMKSGRIEIFQIKLDPTQAKKKQVRVVLLLYNVFSFDEVEFECIRLKSSSWQMFTNQELPALNGHKIL